MAEGVTHQNDIVKIYDQDVPWDYLDICVVYVRATRVEKRLDISECFRFCQQLLSVPDNAQYSNLIDQQIDS